jgi:hypothetical protein
MRLSPDQIVRFYDIWKPLLLFVNQRLRVEPTMLDAKVNERWDAAKVYPIREALWADDAVREAFIADNPAHLSQEDLAIVESWRYRVAGGFTIFRHLKKHSIVIGDDHPSVYAVLGLVSSLEELVPFTPCFAKMVLLPFKGQIIYDSLLYPYNVYIGPGIRRGLEDTYKDAKERGAIITSLPPGEQPVSPAEKQNQVRAVNGRVLEVFRKELYRSGLGPKVVERDVATVAAFADYLVNRPEPVSLREFGSKDVKTFLTSLQSKEEKESRYKQGLTGLTRLVRSLRDTARMDYDVARGILGLLKKGKRQ